MRRLALASLACLIAASAAAQDDAEPYLDDRSGPAELVKSLYNAINRGEFARAYSYFAEPPAADLAAYEEGYANTGHVEVLVGNPGEEGAAGSVYYQIPVAIRATAKDGAETVFAGCYTLRMANPAIQADSFEPLKIERGALQPAEGSLEEALPTSCGDGAELPAFDPSLQKARAIYGNLDRCATWKMAGDAPKTPDPDIYPIEFNYEYDDEDTPQRVAKLYRFLCSRGAYNEGHVYFLANEDGEVSPLHFAVPELDIRYADSENEKVESITVTGFTAEQELVNSDYDPQAYSMSSFAKWRGIGDASSAATWEFRQGRFRLVQYTVDASYDGEMNGETVVDYAPTP